MIKLQNVSKVYENGTIGANNISIELPDNGMVAITGTSGCGKSTLLNLLSNNDIVTSGEITYNDKNYKDISNDILTKDFGYIYQDFKLIDNLTVYQNVMLGHELATENLDYDFVLEVCKDLGLEKYFDEKVYSLSGGQQQRVAIARALVRQPKVVFADEPTGNLDSNNSINVYNILRKLAENTLVVVVSHDIEISTWADRVITLLDGKLVGDEAGKAVAFVETQNNETTAEDEEIEEILQLQNKVKSKKASSFFSYKNKPKAERKKARLSGRTALGLSAALLNKDVVKKVFLTIVMVILIAFMTLSCAMTFATTEKTFANAINANHGKKVFSVKPEISDATYFISNKDINEFDKMLDDSMLSYYEIADGEVIANGWGEMYPTNEGIKTPVYYALMELGKMNNAIFTNDPKDAGIDIVLGKAPTDINEITISKSYYDYLLYYKDFAVTIGENEYYLEFTEKNILDRLLQPFNVKISGVFDDKNSLDNDLKNKYLDDITATEQENYEQILNEQFNTNCLINLVVKSENARDAWQQFAGVSSTLNATILNCYSGSNKTYFDFMPYNDVTKNYYGWTDNYSLSGNEIIVTKDILQAWNKYFAASGIAELKEGDMFNDFAIARMSRYAPNMPMYPAEFVFSESVKIVKVVDSLPGKSDAVLMSNELFAKCKVYNKYSTNRLISCEHVTSGQLAKLNKAFNKYFSSKFDSHKDIALVFAVQNCPMTKTADFGIVYILQSYVCIPLMLVTIAMAVGIIVVFYFDFVKTKAKELLILKSLGSKTTDYLSIYGIFCISLIVIQMLFGLLLGSLLIYCINIFASSISGYLSMFSIFYLDSLSWLFTIFVVVAINMVSLFICLVSLSNKNLRKAFQKLKK